MEAKKVAKLEDMGNVIETDVLVIGGGAAGLWAANRAKQFVEDVLIVDKAPPDLGGQACTRWRGLHFTPPRRPRR